MNTEIFMEGHRLDVSSEISALLSFALDDVKDFSSRSTTFSKTIVLPGTGNNNNVFGNIFQVGQANYTSNEAPNVGYNFNASKSADCIIFTGQIQAFTGVLRLMEINITKGRPEYEVSVFGKLAGLNVALSGGKLEDLDFSAYDHAYNTTNILNSWNNTPGTGIYYPLIDYGTYSSGGTSGKKNWDIRTLRPAIYAREVIDKMITAAGFRWNSPLFDTARFKSIIIPNNQKKLFRKTSNFITGSITSNQQVLFHDGSGSIPLDYNFLTFGSVSVASNFTNFSNEVFQYNQPSAMNARIRYTIKGTFGTTAASPPFRALAGLAKNVSTPPNYDTTDFVQYDPVVQLGNVLTPFEITRDFYVTLNQNDTISLFAEIEFAAGSGDSYELIVTEASFNVESQDPTLVEVSPGDTIGMNDILPKNVRQIDFLLSIVKLFNIYVYEDRFDTSKINFIPYIDFYGTDSSNSIDWTYKLNRDKPVKVKPMSELNAKKYEFKWKPDNDYYNELYRKRYGQGYGDYIFDSQFEFAEQTKGFDLIFSSTPLVGYASEDKVFPTIFKRSGPDNAPVEENVDSNIRLLLSKKLTGVVSWDIKDGSTVLASTTDYGYAGHFDDPDAPTNDLNFGVNKELFFLLAGGNVSVTQFNVYWSAYMAEITDKDSKLLAGSFYLTSMDILSLDFSKFIYLDGVLFRLNKITDFNMSKYTDCSVQLLKVNYLIF